MLFRSGPISDTFQSAFIYISEWNMTNPTTPMILETITQNNKGYKLFPFNGVPNYWILFVNHCPVPDTVQNHHQIAETNRILSERVGFLEDLVLAMLNGEKPANITKIMDKPFESMEPKQVQKIEQTHFICNNDIEGTFEDIKTCLEKYLIDLIVVTDKKTASFRLRDEKMMMYLNLYIKSSNETIIESKLSYGSKTSMMNAFKFLQNYLGKDYDKEFPKINSGSDSSNTSVNSV